MYFTPPTLCCISNYSDLTSKVVETRTTIEHQKEETSFLRAVSSFVIVSF